MRFIYLLPAVLACWITAVTGEESTKPSSGSGGAGANAGVPPQGYVPLGGASLFNPLGGGLAGQGSLLGNPLLSRGMGGGIGGRPGGLGGIPSMFVPPQPLSGGQCNKKSGPVCGVNGNTYDSECDAHRSHEAIECHGRCPCDNNCICTADYNPVCGSDGKTYGNKCSAECKNVTVDCKGKCPCPCPCTLIHDPVCGENNRDYMNPCAASCENVKVACKKRCPCDSSCESICPKNSNPVCGTDGETYQNPCVAQCKNVPIRCNGGCPCRKVCFCPERKQEVCGVNGVTYINPCMAQCQRIRVACKGACPCKRTCICPKTHEPVCGSDGQNYTSPCLAQCKNVIAQCRGNCPCRPACFCPLNLPFMPPTPPVCGVNGIQYPSACQARCENVEVSCIGPCPCTARRKCKCPKTNQQLPVCGTDGQTHQSVCHAACQGVAPLCDGQCPCLLRGIGAGVGGGLPGFPGLPGGAGGQRPGGQQSGGRPSGNQNGGQGGNSGNTNPQCSQCPDVDNKVCGTDGKTYANPCQALCRQVKVQCGNECPCKVKPQEPAQPPSNPAPSQQTSGKSDACQKCDDVNIYNVCSDNGTEYMHACLALCNGANIQCVRTTCPCPAGSHLPQNSQQQQNPPCNICYERVPELRNIVCGANNEEYISKDCAECSGVEVAKTGPC